MITPGHPYTATHFFQVAFTRNNLNEREGPTRVRLSFFVSDPVPDVRWAARFVTTHEWDYGAERKQYDPNLNQLLVRQNP